MKDLDQFMLKQLADDPKVSIEDKGEIFVLVPLMLLRRVTSHFDVEDVRCELSGPRYYRQ